MLGYLGSIRNVVLFSSLSRILNKETFLLTMSILKNIDTFINYPLNAGVWNCSNMRKCSLIPSLKIIDKKYKCLPSKTKSSFLWELDRFKDFQSKYSVRNQIDLPIILVFTCQNINSKSRFYPYSFRALLRKTHNEYNQGSSSPLHNDTAEHLRQET